MSDTGAELAANDTAVSATTEATQDTQHTEAENTEAEEGHESDEQDGEKGQDADDIEIDVDGTKIRIARKVKDAIAKPFAQDYHKKTEALARQREALDSDREGFKTQAEAQKTHFQAATKLAALDEQLAPYANVNWPELYQTNPDAYHQHRAIYDQLKDRRETAARDFSKKEEEYRQNAARENDTRVQKAAAEITQHLPEWAPGNDLDIKLTQYGISLGLPAKEMGEVALRIPQLVKELDRLRRYDEAAAKQKTQQTFAQSQQAKPVTRVGGNSGSAARKTTDASGDALSTEEWVKRERERVAKLRQSSGRR